MDGHEKLRLSAAEIWTKENSQISNKTKTLNEIQALEEKITKQRGENSKEYNNKNTESIESYKSIVYELQCENKGLKKKLTKERNIMHKLEKDYYENKDEQEEKIEQLQHDLYYEREKANSDDIMKESLINKIECLNDDLKRNKGEKRKFEDDSDYFETKCEKLKRINMSLEKQLETYRKINNEQTEIIEKTDKNSDQDYKNFHENYNKMEKVVKDLKIQRKNLETKAKENSKLLFEKTASNLKFKQDLANTQETNKSLEEQYLQANNKIKEQDEIIQTLNTEVEVVKKLVQDYSEVRNEREELDSIKHRHEIERLKTENLEKNKEWRNVCEQQQELIIKMNKTLEAKIEHLNMIKAKKDELANELKAIKKEETKFHYPVFKRELITKHEAEKKKLQKRIELLNKESQRILWVNDEILSTNLEEESNGTKK